MSKLMLSAIKNRRLKNANVDDLDLEEDADLPKSAPAGEAPGGQDLKSLVASLGPDQQAELLKMLQQQAPGEEEAPEEVEELDEELLEDEEAPEGELEAEADDAALDDFEDDEYGERDTSVRSDENLEDVDKEVAKGLVDQTMVRNMKGRKPRNLTERAQMRMAKALKKG